jgi:hypothetical protein
MRRSIAGLAAGVLTATMGATAFASAPLPDQDSPVESGHKVSICHATSSSNPAQYWEVITVDVASTGGRNKLRAHIVHTGDPKQDGRLDVIPTFTYDGVTFDGASDPGNAEQWDAFVEASGGAAACEGTGGIG